MIRRSVLVAAATGWLILAPTAAMSYAVTTYAGQVPVARVPVGRIPAVGVPAGQVPSRVSLPSTGPKPGAGVPFTVKASGAKANDLVTLTITRHPASGTPPRLVTKPADAAGSVEFAVTLTEDGTYSLLSTGPTGAVLGSQSVTVTDHGAVIVAGESASASVSAPSGSTGRARSGTPGGAQGGATAGAGADDQLSFTGFRGSGLAVGGGVLVLAGVGLVLASRRRDMAETSASSPREECAQACARSSA